MMMHLEGFKEPLLVAHWPLWKGFGGKFLAAAYTICFRDPPCFSPARHWFPTMLFLDGTERRFWASRRAPRPSQSIGVYPANFSFERKELFGCFANWFWCVSAIEDPLWTLKVFWVFCQLVLTCIWRQGPFVLESVCLGLCIGHPCWRVCDSSIFWCVCVCVCVPFVWLVFLLPFVKWEIQVHFIRKTLAMILWLKKKKDNFLTIYNNSIF